MIKKLSATAVAVGAISIALAGPAWADPPSDGGPGGNHTSNSNHEPQGKGLGAGGLPKVFGGGLGQDNNVDVSEIAMFEGSVPDAIEDIFCVRAAPGLANRQFTPANGNGNALLPSTDPC